jgi:hypothetical protein
VLPADVRQNKQFMRNPLCLRWQLKRQQCNPTQPHGTVNVLTPTCAVFCRYKEFEVPAPAATELMLAKAGVRKMLVHGHYVGRSYKQNV